MSDTTIIRELLKRSEFKADNYTALAHKAAASGNRERAMLYRLLAQNAESDATEYRMLLQPYANANEYASA